MYRELIRERYEHLSKSQKRIADYLMVSPREAAFMTASRLASLLNVDIATITRFAQRLSFQGYPVLLADVRSVVRLEMSAGYQPVEGISDAGRAFVHALALERDNIDRTMSMISIDAVEKAIAALQRADHVYVAGQHLSEDLTTRLHFLGIAATVVRGHPAFVAPALIKLRSSDVVIGIGMSEHAEDVVGALRIAHERGATTIGITGSEVSPVARLADIALICSQTSPLHLPSESALMAVIEGLWQALAATRMDALSQNMRALSAMMDDLTHNDDDPPGTIEDSVMRVY